MPKISKRRQPHGQQAPRSAAILSQAHKVSFEEGSQSSSSNSLKSSHSSCGTLIPRTSPCSNMLLMSTLLERKPTPTTSLVDMTSSDEESDTDIPDRSRTVSGDEECTSTSPWGQFVDVIPHDDYCSWPVSYEPCSPVLHTSPAYHPYLKNPTAKKHVKQKSTAGLPSVPNKRSVTRKLQQRKSPDINVEEAFELLRF